MGTSTASFDIDARTDRGRQRSNNQDSIGRADRWKNRDGQPIERSLRERYGRLYIVADGVGGNADGADASRMVVDEVMKAFYYDTRLPEEPVERLRAAIEFATSVIHAEAHRRHNNMASTIVAALIHDSTLTIANVGDSPALLCRPGQTPKLLTKAHVRRESDGGTSLAQAMGDQQVVPSIFSMPLEEGDAVVLCSDGLTDLVQPDEIAGIVSTRMAGDATRTLIALANRRGGHDNISAIVGAQCATAKRRRSLRRSASAHGGGSPGSGRATRSGAADAPFAERYPCFASRIIATVRHVALNPAVRRWQSHDHPRRTSDVNPWRAANADRHAGTANSNPAPPYRSPDCTTVTGQQYSGSVNR
jgi:serine/threonine protein phosphatase PrpC